MECKLFYLLKKLYLNITYIYTILFHFCFRRNVRKMLILFNKFFC